MRIRKVAVGNNQEAFFEERLKDGINIISSDDNNKGKTLVIQSMMYSLGNDPVFPSSFNYKDYYHYVEIVNDFNEEIFICRKGDSFVVEYNGIRKVFDSLAEFKYFIKENIFDLPKIIKDNFVKIVDPILFYQLFFVGQDARDTSNINLKGYYNKDDFLNMIFSYKNINHIISDEGNEKELKVELKKLKRKRNEIEKKNKFLKENIPAINVLSISNNKDRFNERLLEIEQINNKILNLNKLRSKATIRKLKNETTLKELNSLNRTLEVGRLHCLDCYSKNIGYSTADKSYTFDITNTEIRKQILQSIEDKVSVYQDEILQINYKISALQTELNDLLEDDEISVESLLLYKSITNNLRPADNEIMNIDSTINKINLELKNISSEMESEKQKQIDLINKIVEGMNSFYKVLDPQGNLEFKELFSTKNSVYSGCEATEFYLSKLYSIRKALDHNFPIIVDHFRAGELSSAKEKIVLKEFNDLNNQIIFTVTLKDEEAGKYDNFENLNHINYLENKPYKLLSATHLNEFRNLINRFNFAF